LTITLAIPETIHKFCATKWGIQMTTLLGISGSLRRGSFNTALIHEAARLFAPDQFTLADIRFPLYDGDLEDSDGIPDIVVALHNRLWPPMR